MITNYSNVLRQPQSQHTVEPVKKPYLRKERQSLATGLILLMMLCLAPLSSFAQSITNYTFSTTTDGSLEDLTVGATVLMTGNRDTAATGVFPIGFDFYFMGTKYTHFSGNSNGQLRLHQSSTETAIPTNVTGPIANMVTLFPMTGDNEVNDGMKFKMVGTKAVIEWTQFYAYYFDITNAGNMQVWLHQDGRIEYVYGDIYNADDATVTRSIGLSSSNTATTAGYITLGATPTFTAAATFVANTFAAGSGTTTGSPLIANLGSSANGSRRVFSFIPIGAPGNSIASILAPPTALNFTAVSPVSMTLNWTPASPLTGVLKYAIYVSTDGVNYNFLNTTNVGTNSYVISNLVANTNYTWKIFSISEGGKSIEVIGSQATTLPGSNTAIASGNWSNTATWSSGAVPNEGDNVTIAAGTTVTQDDAAAKSYNLTVDGNLVYSATTAANLVVGNNVTINSTGNLTGPATGTVVTHGLTVGGNLVNNGVLDLSTNTAGVILTFNGTLPSNFTGTGSVNDLYSLSLSKSSISVLVEVNLTNFSVRGLSTLSTGALLNGTDTGTLKFSGTNTFDGTLWNTGNYPIGVGYGFWLNNPNFTVNAMNTVSNMQGLFRVSAGTYNIGTVEGNSLNLLSNSKVIVEGGTINSASRIAVSAAANIVNFTQTGGTINVNSVGNTSTTFASFDLGTSVTSTVSITGGDINVILANTATSGPRDVRGTSIANPTLTGGSVNFGTTASGAAKTFFFTGSIPKFTINNASANHSLSLSGNASTFLDVTVPASSTLNLNGNTYTNRGSVLTNNGTLTGTASGSTLYFLSTAVTGQTYTGTGIVTPGLGTVSVNTTPGNLTIDPATSGINTLRVNLFTGTVINSNKISIGTGAAVSATVQIGSTGLTTPGGNFDVSPVFNLGTGLYSVLYQPETALRTTGFEIPSTRTVNAMTVNNTNGVVLAGGPVDVLSTLTLTAGNITTTDTNYLGLGSPTVAGTLSGGSATSFVNGPFRRTFASRTATGTYSATTLFPVGKGALYTPMYIDPTVTGPVVMSGEVFATNSGTLGGGVETLGTNRWEGLIKSGSSNFTSSFIRLSDGLSVSTNKILQASSAAGAYGSILPATNFVAGTPNTLTTGTAITAANYLGYFSYGNLNICAMPTSQATTFVASGVGSTFFSGSFTAAADSPSHYLVVRYASGATPVNPVDYTAYTVGGTLGTGTVVAVLSAPNVSFAQTGLTAGTTYNYYIYSYNNVSCYGPTYNVITPLMGTVTTCAAATTAPSALVSSAITANSFTLGWTAVATSSLILDVATNNTFTTFVPGYNAKPLVAGTTSELVSGLTANTPYYVRLRAVDGSCNSVYSSTLTVVTDCNSVTEFSENFDAVLAPAMPTCWFKVGSNGTVNTQTASFSSAPNTLYMYSSSATSRAVVKMPPVSNAGANTHRLRFKLRANFTAGETVEVGYLTNSTDATSFVPLQSFVTADLVYSEKVVVPGTAPGTNQYLAFRTGTLAYSVLVDDVVWEAIQLPTITSFASTVACGNDTELTITGTNLTGASVTINGTPFTPTSISDTQIVIPVNTTISGNIVVSTSPGGTVTSATAFAFTSAPALTLSETSTAICSGDSSSIINVTAGASDYDTFVWSPATGVTGNQTTGFTFNGSVSGVYTLTASQSSSDCSRTASFALTVNTPPSAITIAPTAAVLCQGSVQSLVASGPSSGTATIGSATTLTGATTQPTAFCNRYDHYWSQMVFTAAELTAAGLHPGNINSLSFNITSIGSAPNVTDFKIYMGSTTNSVMTSFVTTGLTQVFSAATYTQTIGANAIVFSTPYNWNGTSNIIIDIRQTGVDSINNAETYFTATTGNTVLYAFTSTVNAGGSDGFAASSPTATTSKNRLNTTFNWAATPVVVWSPVADLYTDAAATIPYTTGTNASTVYLKGSATTPASYTVTTSYPSGCSKSASVSVTVNTTAAPTGTSPQDYLTGETLASLEVTGTGIIWYDAPTGGAVLPSTTLLVSGVVYYASQTVNGCESPTRLAVTAGTNLKVDGFNFNSLKYYPNPVNNVLTVSYSQEITGLKLYNMVGQELMNKKVSSTEAQLDMSNLPAGSYLLEVSSGAQSKMVKLLKNQ